MEHSFFLFSPNQRIHFTGIGGAGMFPFAVICAQRGCIVTGSDLISSKNTEILKTKFNIPIAIGPHQASNLPIHAIDLLIHTSAAQPNNPEIIEAQKQGTLILRRGEALAHFAHQCQRPVVISGSHGKTSITAILTHILKKTMINPGFLIGGKVNNWSLPSNAGDSDIFVAEADESDGSHTVLHPYLGIIPNIEDDHVWSTGGKEQLFCNFQTFAKQSKKLLYLDIEPSHTMFQNHPDAISISSENITAPNYFKYLTAEELKEWGDFQLINAALAVKAAELLGITRKEAESALPDFPGIERRMTLRGKKTKAVLIEDYAHHPTELNAALSAIRKIYPGWRIQVIFQPHRYARLKRYIHEFAEILKTVDQVWVTPVFAAWVKEEELNHHDLVKKIGSHAVVIPNNNWEQAANTIDINFPHEKGTVTAIIGAGDVNQIIPFLAKKMEK